MMQQEPKMLDCMETMRRLDDYLSRALKAEEMAQVQAHLEMCERCFQRFHFDESLVTSLRRRAAAAHVPGEVRSRVFAALATVEPVRPGLLGRLRLKLKWRRPHCE